MTSLYFSFIRYFSYTILRSSLSTGGSTLGGEALLTLTTIRFTSSSWYSPFLAVRFLSLSVIVLEKSTILLFCWESVGSTGPRASLRVSKVYGAVPRGFRFMKRLPSGWVEWSMLAYSLFLWVSTRDILLGVSMPWLWSCYMISAAIEDGIDVFGSRNFTSSDWLTMLPQGSLLGTPSLKLF